jgi:hypothetical protein
MQDFVQQVYAFNQRLRTRAERKVWAFQAGVRKAGYYVFQLTQAAVPVDTGELKASGWMRFAGAGNTFTFTIGYSAPHAIYVHEDLTVYHAQGQAKFVEGPMRQARGTVNTIIVSSIRAAA